MVMQAESEPSDVKEKSPTQVAEVIQLLKPINPSPPLSSLCSLHPNHFDFSQI